MGITSAYTLHNTFPDAEISLFDPKGFPAPNASFIAGGMLSPYSELDHMPHSYLEAGCASIGIWEDLSAQCDSNIEFSQNGSLIIAHDADEFMLRRFISILPKDDENWSGINQKQIQALEPALPAHIFRSGLFMKNEAHLHPQKVMREMLEQINRKVIQEFNIDKQSDAFDWIIDCSGISSHTQASTLRGVKGETVVVRNPDFKLSRPLRLMHPRYPLYIVPRADDIFMIGATIIESDARKTLSIRSAMELMSALYIIHPSFGDAEIIRMDSDIRPSYADNMPQIHQDGKIISCNGLFRHGYLFAPIMAQCAASIISQTDYTFNSLFIRTGYDEYCTKRQQAHA